MMPGLALFYGGLVGAKNVVATMVQSFVAIGVISCWSTARSRTASGGRLRYLRVVMSRWERNIGWTWKRSTVARFRCGAW